MEDLFIIKIGGDTLNNESSLKNCISAISESGKNVILVHGGGKKVTELADKLGIQQQMIEGRRITSPETMNICTMVYAGLINKNIVAQFSSFNKKSIGITGADLNCIISTKRQHPTIQFGCVGDVKEIKAEVFKNFIQQDVIPVCCSVTLSTENELLNTNADTIASEIAKEMSPYYKTHLIYCFEKNGVLTDVSDENSVLKSISQAEFNSMKESKQIADGMIPKLQTAFKVLFHGGNEVHIINAKFLNDYFKGEKPGTQINLHE